jgi:hypothetical protein
LHKGNLEASTLLDVLPGLDIPSGAVFHHGQRHALHILYRTVLRALASAADRVLAERSD